MPEVSVVLALCDLTCYTDKRVENLLRAGSSSSLSYPCKICPSHHTQQTTDDDEALSLPGTHWGVLPSGVAMGSSLGIPLAIRFSYAWGEHLMSRNLLVETDFTRLFGCGPGQTCFIMSSAGE